MTYPSFNVGDVLTAADMNAVGLWRITTCTVSSTGGTAATASNGVITLGNGNTSVTISNAFSADYHGYIIRGSNGSGSTPANIQMQLGTSNTGYYSSGNVWNVTGTSTNIPDNNASSFSRIGQMTANALNLNVELWNPQLAKYTLASWTYNLYDATTNNFGLAMGTHAVNTAYTAFTLTPATGSFSSGTIRVYGFRL